MEHGFQPGQMISFRLPADTPKPVIEYLSQLKETEEESFGKKISQLFINGVHQALIGEKPTITIPLPEYLTPEQRDWFNHPFTRELLRNWICQLTFNPSLFLGASTFEIATATVQQESVQQKETQQVVVEREKDQLEEVQPAEVTETTWEKKHSDFEVSTSYHAKLVGFFMDD
ncbi:hypothetical protein [Effusibacillus consociatus]|uniref:Uncharacterized protein n=1 Tax=Effusibacillus consociatus TaxID=1117041 RepID=A0ABV9PXZ4_9BACL